MLVNDYQQNLRGQLQEILNSLTVCEWRTQMDANTYSPRLDVAVGPFSLANGIRLIEEYNELFENNIDFVARLVKTHLTNLNFINDELSEENANQLINDKLNDIRYFNFNSRCFIAIEIENSVSRKHLMGGAINASVLGRIGIAVGFTEEMHNAFLNLYRYFSFLQSVDKPTFRTNNLLVISAGQLINICNEPE